MKKIFTMLFITTVLSVMFTACGDGKDEPVDPETQNLESVYENEGDTYFLFDIDMTKDKSTIYMYNIQFEIGESVSPQMTLRVDVPVSFNSINNAYVLSGTGLVAEMQRGSSWVPMPNEEYQLNNLLCMVKPSAKLYSISFDAYGGHFEQSGKLK